MIQELKRKILHLTRRDKLLASIFGACLLCTCLMIVFVARWSVSEAGADLDSEDAEAVFESSGVKSRGD